MYLLDDKEYKKIGVPKDNNFIRNRKMSFVDIILFILNNKGKTLTIELNDLWKNMEKNV